MQEHAVPRDITGFKFKLVGDMTIKQFGELAFGAICAYIIYASGLYAIIKWPLVVFFALFGVALAFLPIAERPLDVWLINFFRAIYKPTYYVWKKDLAGRVVSEEDFTPGYMAPSDVTRAQPQTVTQPAAWPAFGSDQKTNPVKKEPETPRKTPEEAPAVGTAPSPGGVTTGKVLSVEELLKQRQTATSAPVTTPPVMSGQPVSPVAEKSETTPQPMEKTSPTAFTVDQLADLRQQKQVTNEQAVTQALSEGEKEIEKQANLVKGLMIQIDELKNRISVEQGRAQEDLAKTLNGLLDQRAKEAEKLSQLRKTVSDTRVSAVASPEYKEPIKSPAKIRVVPKTQPAQPAAIRLTDLPNVINGQVTDNSGKPLESVILVIKDQAGNSVRAFKTSKIGQFIVSTPMQDGTYILELEKNGYDFDTLEVTLSGQVLAPLTIKANQKIESLPTIQP